MEKPPSLFKNIQNFISRLKKFQSLEKYGLTNDINNAMKQLRTI